MLPGDLTGAFTIDADRTHLGFTARHAVITKVRGRFAEFAGTAFLDAAEPTSSSAELTIEAVSIDTGNPARDGELRTNAFLDVPSHPLITFVSTSVRQAADRRFELTGELTIKAVSRPITLRFELVDVAADGGGAAELTFRGAGSINRRDFAVEWPAPLETGGVLVGDKVGLEISVVATSAQ